MQIPNEIYDEPKISYISPVHFLICTIYFLSLKGT